MTRTHKENSHSHLQNISQLKLSILLPGNETVKTEDDLKICLWQLVLIYFFIFLTHTSLLPCKVLKFIALHANDKWPNEW